MVSVNAAIAIGVSITSFPANAAGPTAREWQRLAPRKIAGPEARTAKNNRQRSAADHLCRLHS